MKTNDRKGGCCSCEERFETHIDGMVRKGEAPTREAHARREKEARDAFAQGSEAKSGRQGRNDASIQAGKAAGKARSEAPEGEMPSAKKGGFPQGDVC